MNSFSQSMYMWYIVQLHIRSIWNFQKKHNNKLETFIQNSGINFWTAVTSILNIHIKCGKNGHDKILYILTWVTLLSFCNGCNIYPFQDTRHFRIPSKKTKKLSEFCQISIIMGLSTPRTCISIVVSGYQHQ